MTKKRRQARARFRNWKPAPTPNGKSKLLPWSELDREIFKKDRTEGIFVRR